MDLQHAPSPARFEVEQNGKRIDVFALPEGWSTEKIKDPALDHTPAVISGLQTAADTPSFKQYFTRFSGARTLVTASRSGSRITAHLDYHLNADTPSPNKHSLNRQYKKDRRFAAWKERNKKAMTQTEFVEFLEDRLSDVRSPDQAELMGSIVKFKAFRSANCAAAVDLPSGDMEFVYTQITKNEKGQAVMPERIVIQVPVLEFEREWQIGARLRYRLVEGEGRLSFWYELTEIDAVEDQAFRQAVDDLSQEIKAGILLTD